VDATKEYALNVETVADVAYAMHYDLVSSRAKAAVGVKGRQRGKQQRRRRTSSTGSQKNEQQKREDAFLAPIAPKVRLFGTICTI
jgi:hypothetical protein